MRHKCFKTILLSALIILTLFSQGSFVMGETIIINELEQQIQDRQKMIQELEKKVAELREAIKGKQSTQNTLKKQITSMEAEINRLQLEIRLTQTKINETGLQINKLTSQIVELEEKINNHREYLSNAIRIINEYDKEDVFEILLKNNSLSDFLDQVEYMENLQNEIQVSLEEIKILKGEANNEKQKQEEYKNSLQSLNEDLTSKNLVLNFQKDDKEDLLSSTRNQEKIYQAQLKELQKQREEIQKSIYELEDKLRMAIDPNSIPGTQKGLFSWPLKNGITQTYGPTSQTGFINNVYSFHNGIDIGAHTGDAVKAPYDGVVSGAGNNGKYAYGKWITINHQNGLTTLYGHLSVQKVSAGQEVKRGEVIGYAGSTGFSTGPHLHFTVYSTKTFKIESRWFGALPIGGSINPMNYLE